MKNLDSKSMTPICVKNNDDMSWPNKENAFYLVSSDGLFICRNHEFFRSCVPSRGGPSELSRQEAFIDIRYPKLPQLLLEKAVGFLWQVGEHYNAESALIWCYNRKLKKNTIIVPKQLCSVYRSGHKTNPIGVQYELPVNLSDDLIIIGSIHSHVDGAAFASATDKKDEVYRPGIHIVVGRIYNEPPQFHVEAIVDGMRFPINPELIIKGYHRRAKVSEKYFRNVYIEVVPSYNTCYSYGIANDNNKFSRKRDEHQGKLIKFDQKRN